MNITISIGWWLLPALFTVASLLFWAIKGVKMDKSGGYFPDFAGGLIEAGGYVFFGMLSVIAWLIWWGASR